MTSSKRRSSSRRSKARLYRCRCNHECGPKQSRTMQEYVIELFVNVRCCSHFISLNEGSSCGALPPLAFQSLRLIPEDFAILLPHARLLKSLSCWLSITIPN